jgi:hypothetical protein
MKIPDFQYISVPSGLRIICAGVWHNFVLSVIAYLLVQTFIGSILVFPLYTKVDGVIITNTYGVYNNIHIFGFLCRIISFYSHSRMFLIICPLVL